MIATVEAAPFSKSVEETRNRHIAAINAGDADAATRLFAPYAVILPPGQPAVEGTTAIETWFNQVFAGFHVRSFSLQPAAVDERGEISIEHGNWSATFMPKDGSSSLPAGGTYLTIYAGLADGSVRIIRDSFNGLPGKG